MPETKNHRFMCFNSVLLAYPDKKFIKMYEDYLLKSFALYKQLLSILYSL